MEFFTHCLFLVFAICIRQYSAYVYFKHKGLEWSYHGNTGPNHWCDMFSTCCGDMQSPINFDATSDHLIVDVNSIFNFTDYDVIPESMTLENSGHTVILTNTDPKIKPSISGGRLNHTYNLGSIHFHWGLKTSRGSEHTISGKQYSLEVHMVHYSSEYKSFDEASESNTSDALAVLGILYNVEWFNNSVLNSVVENLSSVRAEGQKIPLKSPLKLSKLLSPGTGKFFRYKGSLTTPPCNQDVVWTVFGIPNFISEYQLKQFRTLLSTAKGEEPPVEMSDNFRPIQKLNGRKVTVIDSQ